MKSRYKLSCSARQQGEDKIEHTQHENVITIKAKHQRTNVT